MITASPNTGGSPGRPLGAHERQRRQRAPLLHTTRHVHQVRNGVLALGAIAQEGCRILWAKPCRKARQIFQEAESFSHQSKSCPSEALVVGTRASNGGMLQPG